MAKNRLPKKTENLSEWYTRLIQEADLADYGPVKGTMIIKPYGYSLWENVQAAMNPMIKQHGVGNAYFPMFIPMSFLEREKSHVEGFSPELAVVTHGGGKELEEPLAVRPTSETIMYDAYSKWVQSWRDLPIMMNQWNNVVRWEKRTNMFLRTSEFLWQEGHTAHATHEEAIATQQWAMDMYKTIYNDHFALFGYVGEKSTAERFAGADSTLTFEALMPSGKALQSSTSHDLGQNFAKAFDINFRSKNDTEEFVWQTSWGLSTRSLGGLILAHGDDNGLRLPPKLAPVQVVILPVKTDNDRVVEYAHSIQKDLDPAGIRAVVDARDDESIGWRINKWELKGVPIRLEIGDRELEAQSVTLVSRVAKDESNPVSKQTIAVNPEFADTVLAELHTIQNDLFEQSKQFTLDNTFDAKNYDEFKQLLNEKRGFIKVYWNDNPEIEAKIQQETKATSRCSVLEDVPEGIDFFTGEPAQKQWYFAQSY